MHTITMIIIKKESLIDQKILVVGFIVFFILKNRKTKEGAPSFDTTVTGTKIIVFHKIVIMLKNYFRREKERKIWIGIIGIRIQQTKSPRKYK